VTSYQHQRRKMCTWRKYFHFCW